MIKKENTILLIIDIQGKLAQLMHEKESLFQNAQKLVRGIKALEIPIIWAEQNPRGLGPTIPEIADLLSDIQPVVKTSFSCCGSDQFVGELEKLGRRQILITGIETHICVYQTAADLVEKRYEVQVVADAVSSRSLENRQIGLQKIKDTGAVLTSVETALFELLKVADGEQFKEILRIIK